MVETKKIRKSKKIITSRPALDPRKIYSRAEAALTVGVAPITLIRAYDNGHLQAYRLGRKVAHSGQHLLDWLNQGGLTSRKTEGLRAAA